MPTEKELFEQGLGNITWWGFSPAVDITAPLTEDGGQVLLLGAGDGRHILEAAAQHKADKGVLKFFVFEQNLMLYARQMLFMHMLQQFGRENKTVRKVSDLAKSFMEIYGNINVRPTTNQWIRECSGQIRQKVCDFQSSSEGSTDILPNVDLSRLKSKELDGLEAILKAWAISEEGHSVDLNEYWDFRLRQLLMDRYDAKDGIFEMDYQLRLMDRGGAKVSHKEYLEWRKSGMAFPWNEVEQGTNARKGKRQNSESNEDDDEGENRSEFPNITLVSSIIVKQKDENGRKRSDNRIGFWGDIVSGPFFTYGFEYSNDVQITKTKLERFSQERVLDHLEFMIKNLPELASDWPQVTFLPVVTAERDLLERTKYHATFNLVFMGCSVTHLLTRELVNNIKNEDSIILVETPLYLLHIAKEVQIKFKEHLMQTCSDCDLQIDNNDYDPNKENLVKVKRNRSD